jgi:hypothetical protein
VIVVEEFNSHMGKVGEFAEKSWQRLWCVPQAARERARDTDWNRLELNAIGSVWGRDRFGSQMSRVDGWSATIVAELTR